MNFDSALILSLALFFYQTTSLSGAYGVRARLAERFFYAIHHPVGVVFQVERFPR